MNLSKKARSTVKLPELWKTDSCTSKPLQLMFWVMLAFITSQKTCGVYQTLL